MMLTYEKVKTGMYWIHDSYKSINPSYLAKKCGNKDWRLYCIYNKTVCMIKFKALYRLRLYLRKYKDTERSAWTEMHDTLPKYEPKEIFKYEQ